ncbi:MAG: 3-oxoadipate enol-lactonase [Pseudomonadota bacterium]
MQFITTDAGSIHVSDHGRRTAPAIVFSNSLGTDFRIWDRVVMLLPAGMRVIRYDKRGHGLSDCPPRGTWGMGDHVADAIAVMDALGAKDAIFVGLSVGGMIAQGIAAERPDLVHGMVLCDTGAKIGTPDMWQERIAALEEGGIAPMADAIMERWFSKRFRAEKAAEMAIWRNMLTRTKLDGYIGTCAAIADTDLHESTARLLLPTLAICGDEDGATPPDLVRETASLIPGAEFNLIPDAGHLPCVEQAEMVATHLNAFMKRIGHI